MMMTSHHGVGLRIKQLICRHKQTRAIYDHRDELWGKAARVEVCVRCFDVTALTVENWIPDALKWPSKARR